MSARTRTILAFIVLALIGLAAPYLFPGHLIQITKLWIFVVLALTWDFIGGQMGYNSFGNIVFFGIGMYACAVIQVGMFYPVGAYNEAKGGGTEYIFSVSDFIQGLSIGLPVGGLLAILAAILIGSAVLGMRGHYFAICTLGLGIAGGELAAGWEWIGAGSGMTTPEPPDELNTGILYYFLSMGLAGITFIVLGWLLSTRFGLAINAIRDDEDKAESMGHRTTRIKVIAWSVSALFLGIAGGIYGNLSKFIDPIDTAFPGAELGVWMILMAILGGKGTLWGPVLGAVVFQFTKELFWTYLLGWQRVALGLLIVLIVVFFPQGILGWVRERFPGLFGQKIAAREEG